jgi:hypothetical protein
MRGQIGAGKLDHMLCRAPHKTDADTGAQWAMQQTLDIWTISSQSLSRWRYRGCRPKPKPTAYNYCAAHFFILRVDPRQAGRPAEEL